MTFNRFKKIASKLAKKAGVEIIEFFANSFAGEITSFHAMTSSQIGEEFRKECEATGVVLADQALFTSIKYV